MPGMTWDGDANSQLLLSILAVHDIKVDFEAVAALMGPNCTSRAVQEQLKKLKKLASTKANGASPTAAVAKPAKAPKATTTRAKANANGTKTSKPAAAKKSRITKAKLLRTDSPNAESDNASHDGGLSADDEASSSANGKVNGDSEAAAAAAHKLAGSILSVKRKAEEMDEADGKVAIKKEKVESEDEGEDDEAIEEESQRTGGTPSEQLWAEVSYGMNDHEMTAA